MSRRVEAWEALLLVAVSRSADGETVAFWLFLIAFVALFVILGASLEGGECWVVLESP